MHGCLQNVKYVSIIFMLLVVKIKSILTKMALNFKTVLSIGLYSINLQVGCYHSHVTLYELDQAILILICIQVTGGVPLLR